MGRDYAENAAAVAAVIDCSVSANDGDALEKSPLPPEAKESEKCFQSQRRTANLVSVASGSVGAFAISGLAQGDAEESITNNSVHEEEDSIVAGDEPTESLQPDTDEAPDVPKPDSFLVSAELVEDDAPVVEAQEVKRIKKHHIFLIVCMFLIAVVAGVAGITVFQLRKKETEQENVKKEAEQDVSFYPSMAPSDSPSMAPTIDYIGKINDYGFITNFIAQLTMSTPDCSSTAQEPSEWDVRIQATCLDGSSNDEFGADSMIYQIGSTHSTSPCVRLDNHVLQCDITLPGRLAVHIHQSGFACGTNSGNATMDILIEPLYDASPCLFTGEMTSSIKAICEIGGNIDSPMCSTANLTAVEERCAIPKEFSETGLYTTLNVPNTTCAALDLESSILFRLVGVLFSF